MLGTYIHAPFVVSIPQFGLNTVLSAFSFVPPYHTLLPVFTSSACPSLLKIYFCSLLNSSAFSSFLLSIYANGESDIDTPSFA